MTVLIGVANVADVLWPVFLGNIIDGFLSRDAGKVRAALWLAIGALAAAQVLRLSGRLVARRAADAILEGLRNRVYTKIVAKVPLTRVFKPGEILARAKDDLSQAADTLQVSAFSAVENVAGLVAPTVALATLQLKLLPVVVLVVGGLVGLSQLTNRALQRHATRQRDLEPKMNEAIEYLSSSAREQSRLYGHRRLQDEFARINAAYISVARKQNTISLLRQTFTRGWILVLAWGIYAVGATRLIPGMSAGEIVSYATLTSGIATPLLLSIGMTTVFQTRLPYWRRLLDTIELPETQPRTGTRDLERSNTRALVLQAGVVVRNLSYTYPNQTVPAVTDVSLTLEVGKSYGVRGPNGSGKSTLVKLLLGLLIPTSGEILVDGVPWAELIQRAQTEVFAWVPQDPALRGHTIIDALTADARWAADEIDWLAVHEVIRIVRLTTEVQAKGWEHPHHDLSGGQQKCLAIAAALLRGAPVLIADEAFSQLHEDTRAEIRAELKRRCVILLEVAHDRSVLEAGHDAIIEMRNGAIHKPAAE